MRHKEIVKIANQTETKSFIQGNIIMFPHEYSDKKDVEISGLISTWLSYLETPDTIKIIAHILNDIMDNKPYEYIMSGNWNVYNDDYSKLYLFTTWHNFAMLCSKLQRIYYNEKDLECAVISKKKTRNKDIKHYYQCLCDILGGETMIPTATSTAMCSRMNLFLRWMVRTNSDVDLGIWQEIDKNNLFVTCNEKAITIAKKLGIIDKMICNYSNMIKITDYSRDIFYQDPSRFDFFIYGTNI